jgi:membrane-associated phospholipid phosphatase
MAMTSRARRTAVAIAVLGATVFIVLTVLVTARGSLGFDADAFTVARDLRAPWLDHVAKLITRLGLIVFVGPAVCLAGAVLIRSGYRARAAALLIGAALAWISVWITKLAVDRPRPSAPLVHTVGQSFPSGHAANAVGWFALAVALTAVVGSRGGRVAIVAVGTLLAALIGLSRIYLRAHYVSDVLAGEALALTMYALAVLAVARASPASGDEIPDEDGQLAT